MERDRNQQKTVSSLSLSSHVANVKGRSLRVSLGAASQVHNKYGRSLLFHPGCAALNRMLKTIAHIMEEETGGSGIPQTHRRASRDTTINVRVSDQHSPVPSSLPSIVLSEGPSADSEHDAVAREEPGMSSETDASA